MNGLPLSHYLIPGTKLAEVITAPDPNFGCATFKLGDESHQAKDITVIEECGQMSMVPWARVELNNGEVRLVNLATVESVTLVKAGEQ